MTKTLTFLFFLFSNLYAYSQTSNNFFFEIEYQLKFSVGTPTTQPYTAFSFFETELPKVSKYIYPVNSLNLNAHYRISNNFSAGLGFGFSFAKYESIPLDPYSYYDKMMIPFYLRFRFDKNLKNDWFIISDLDLGYNYTNNRWRFINDEYGFKAEESGGGMAGINIGVGKSFKKYSPIFKVAYEFSQFSRRNVYSYKQNFQPTQFEAVVFNTYYHLIKIGVAMKF